MTAKPVHPRTDTTRDHVRRAPRFAAGALAAAAFVFAAPHASAFDDYDTEEFPVILQWFEAPWTQMERRAADVFVAGYGAIWMPNPTRADSDASTGYDPLNRFDFGGPGFNFGTAFGTEATWRAMVDEMSGFDLLILPDAVLNHNSGRNGSVFRQEQGGWPGFWMNSDNPPTPKGIGDDWGDFRDGGGTGDIFGDLVGLIDIAHETNHQFIRQPVSAGNPLNIPAGNTYNIPNPANIRFYPDEDAPGRTVFSPGTSRNPTSQNFTFYPWDTENPATGDPVTENVTGYLMRWSRWMIEVQGADGFRLDAAKHIQSWFWDNFFDPAIHMARITPDGRRVNPFTMGENVSGNQFVFDNYVRRDAFAFRDTLDVAGAGDLRNLLNNPFGTSWQTVLNGHIDNINDGFNNGNLGVNHMFSHDNGTVGDGSAPPVPNHKQQGWPFHAYLLMRPGPVIVYLNHFSIPRTFGFYPRAGTNTALGFDPDPNQDGVKATGETIENTLITDLVNLRIQYARGQFRPLNFTDLTNPGLDDVIVFERSTPVQNNGAVWPDDYSANVLVAVNKRYDSGFDTRNVRTSFPPGTRLIEQTGNAADPVVDPTNAVADVLVVDGNRRVTITIPRNVINGVETNRGYLVYAPAVPEGDVTLIENGQTVTSELAPDSSATPWGLRRRVPVPIVTADSLTIELNTSTGDALDPNAIDDDAVFRIDAGYNDANGDGVNDFDHTTGRDRAGFERFNAVRLPGLLNGGSGLYRQTIDTTTLDEGYHYLTVRAFRARNPSEAELWREFRVPFYLDREGPVVQAEIPASVTGPQETFRVQTDDTATQVHMFWNLSPAADPLNEINIFSRATQFDRYTWDKNLDVGSAGCGELTVVAVERTGNASVTRFNIGTCPADITTDGTFNGVPDCAVTLSDFSFYLARWSSGSVQADITQDGLCEFGTGGDGVTLSDFSCYLAAWSAGCP